MHDNSLTLIDWYKADHIRQYPEGTRLVFSNFTPRKCRIKDPTGEEAVVFFGLQYFLKEYLASFMERMNSADFMAMMESSLGMRPSDYHLRLLSRYSGLPIEIWALPEGSIVPDRKSVV